MQKRIIAAIVCLAVLTPVSVAGWKTYARIAPAKAAGAYIRALVTGDKNGALNTSAGAAAFNAQKAAGNAGVVKLDVEVTNVGSGWAEALAYAELALSDGSHDAGWYRAALVQQDRAWKVISLSAAQPWTSGLWSYNPKQDIAAASGAFTAYLKDLSENRYRDAARLLCGEERVAHESGASALDKAPIFKQYGQVQITPLWRRGDQMVCRADYQIDGRAADAIVRFIRLGDGWHILNLNQV